MKCDYTHLNHNFLVSQKKVVTKGVIIKWVYCIYIVGFIIIIILLIKPNIRGQLIYKPIQNFTLDTSACVYYIYTHLWLVQPNNSKINVTSKK
jgi:hypothetical protein